MANVSRNVPPCAAVITIRPAAGGPSRTTFHSSGEKAALVVMACSCAPGDAGHLKSLAGPGRAPHPAGVRYGVKGTSLEGLNTGGGGAVKGRPRLRPAQGAHPTLMR